jgi:hypothetical protein
MHVWVWMHVCMWPMCMPSRRCACAHAYGFRMHMCMWSMWIHIMPARMRASPVCACVCMYVCAHAYGFWMHVRMWSMCIHIMPSRTHPCIVYVCMCMCMHAYLLGCTCAFGSCGWTPSCMHILHMIHPSSPASPSSSSTPHAMHAHARAHARPCTHIMHDIDAASCTTHGAHVHDHPPCMAPCACTHGLT